MKYLNIRNKLLVFIILLETDGYSIISIKDSCLESCSCELDYFNDLLTVQCTELQKNFTFPSNFILEPYLSRARTIIASNNLIQSFPLNICEFNANLVSLDLSFNELTDIKYSYFSCNLNYLKTLRLDNNNITFIENNSFLNMISLQTLNLQNNQIKEIVPSIFSSLRSLQYIYLSGNLLTSMELWPTYISSVMYIDLSYNQIKSFTNDLNWSLEDSYDLPGFYLETNWQSHPLIMFLESTKINLQFNYLTSLDDKTVQQYGIYNVNDYYTFIVKYFWAFDITNNPISCNCTNSKRLLAALFNLSNKISDWAYSPIFQSLCTDPFSNQQHSILSFDYCPTSSFLITESSLAISVTTSSMIATEIFETTDEINSSVLTETSNQTTEFIMTSAQTMELLVKPRSISL